MTPYDATLLERLGIADNGEMVFVHELRRGGSAYDLRWHAWDEAQELADEAYEAWRRDPGRAAYIAYRAAQDRADAAHDALARAARERPAE